MRSNQRFQLSRSIRIWIEGKFLTSESWGNCEKLLEKAEHKGFISPVYTCKSYSETDVVWLLGTPGEDLRDLKRNLEAEFAEGFKNTDE